MSGLRHNGHSRLDEEEKSERGEKRLDEISGTRRLGCRYCPRGSMVKGNVT